MDKPPVDAGFRAFLFNYQHAGARWQVEVKARDLDDAKARLAKMPYATFDGVLVAKLPAVGGSWLAAIICAARNLWRGAPTRG